MSAGAISGALTGAQGGTNSFGQISTQEFLRVMIAELSNQDPFEPQDTSALLEQLSSIRNIESQIGLQDSLESLVLQNLLSSASGLIGKEVTITLDNDSQVVGEVVSVHVQGSTAQVELDTGERFALDQVTQIRQRQIAPLAT